MSELIDLTAAQAAERIRAGEISAAEVFEAYRERAAADELNAFTWVAEAAPETNGHAGKPLGGVPVAVKDLFCTEGVPSQSGSKILEGYRPPYTATVVEKLRVAGAPLLGKTNQDEFAMGSSNENSGFGPVLNPWDRTRVPGGSSGGSAAAVAAGHAPWALGTDTGGSIRQPAALSGIVGLKPTYGACSRYGMIAFASSLDQAGPLTRDVTDAALLFRHMIGRDRLDSTSLEFPGEIASPSAENLKGIRLGVPQGPDRRRRRDRARGAQTSRRRSRWPSGWARPLSRAAAARAARSVGLLPDRAGRGVGEPGALRRGPYGLRVNGDKDLVTMYEPPARSARARVKRRIICGTYALSSGYTTRTTGPRKGPYEDRRRLPGGVRPLRLHRDPDQPVHRVQARGKTAAPLAMYLNDFLAVPMSLAGIPAISIPSGLSGGCRSASSWPVRRSARAACSMPLRARRGDRVRWGAANHPAPPGGTMVYEPVIGLEIHVQLDTRTKMFCGCELSFNDPPNIHTYPPASACRGRCPW